MLAAADWAFRVEAPRLAIYEFTGRISYKDLEPDTPDPSAQQIHDPGNDDDDILQSFRSPRAADSPKAADRLLSPEASLVGSAPSQSGLATNRSAKKAKNSSLKAPEQTTNPQDGGVLSTAPASDDDEIELQRSFGGENASRFGDKSGDGYKRQS